MPKSFKVVCGLLKTGDFSLDFASETTMGLSNTMCATMKRMLFKTLIFITTHLNNGQELTGENQILQPVGKKNLFYRYPFFEKVFGVSLILLVKMVRITEFFNVLYFRISRLKTISL